MNIRRLFFFIIFPIVLATSGEFFLKSAINSNPISLSPNLFESMLILLKVPVNHPMILFSLIIIVTGGVLWIIAMSKFELSFIYPFMSINYVMIMVGSQLFLHESVSLVRYLAVVFIGIGLIFISRSPNAKK
tara:strand:- start:605 stop:1000 length:396 start_codon:yes stop_codon:yes gene_type:complete